MDQGHLTLLAFNLAIGDQVRDGPLQGLVHRSGRAGGLGNALEEVDDDCRRFDVSYVTLNCCNVHGCPPYL